MKVSRILLGLTLASAICSHVHGQIAVTANKPLYNFQVLPGSTRQINVQIMDASSQCVAGGGRTCRINWSVSSSSGSASATFTDPTHNGSSSISSALPTIQVNIGSTAGSCSISGSGPYTVSSTATVTVQAQSTDDTSKTASFLFNVCANQTATLANATPSVKVVPAYQQAYQLQPMTLQSWVMGCTDETGTWSITSQPGGGDGALIDTTYRDALFSASVTGRYTITYTSTCNSGTSSAIVYVSPNALPSYAATPNQTRPHECYVDPALTGGDYEVGAGKAYTTLAAVPAITGWTPGTIMRVHNTDVSGVAPSTFHEYFQIQQSGTATQPIIMCGVPDSLGNLPILDGANAHGQAGMRYFAPGVGTYAVVLLFPSSHYGYWSGGSLGPNYVSVTGLHVRNSQPTYSATMPNGGSGACDLVGGTGICNYITGAAAIYVGSGSYIDISGNDLDNGGNGLFTAENANNAWSTITQQVSVLGNHFHNNGVTGDDHEHQIYFQSFYGLEEGNLFDNYNCHALGSQSKWRGVEGIFRYNYIGAEAPGCDGPARDFDLVDNEDAGTYSDFERFLTSGLYPLETAGANVIAAYQESQQKDFIYGNLIFPAGQNQVHYFGDHGDTMSNRNGTLYFYSNTMPGAEVIVDNGFGGDGFNSYLQPRVDFRNNIFWPDTTRGYGAGSDSLNSVQTMVINAVTNLWKTGSIDITTPLNPPAWNSGVAAGFVSGCDGPGLCKWPISLPFETHITGLSAGNFLSTGTTPIDLITLAPVGGSAAIGAGTALTGIPAQLPVRYQYATSTSSLTARTHPLDIGAVDSGGASPTLVSIAVTPAGSSLMAGLTLQYVATCTWSDASVTTCTGSVTWASSAPSKATIAGGGLATAVAAGSTTITATSGIITGSTGLTVTAATLVSIAVTPSSASLAVSSTLQYVATCHWSDATTTTCTGSSTWTSSDTGKATISAGGLATGIAGGSTTITATISAVSGSTGLTVTAGTVTHSKAHGVKFKGVTFK